MGAWIEIRRRPLRRRRQGQSHPSWVRGLKFQTDRQRSRYPGVAPFMGAWIEIRQDRCRQRRCLRRTLHGCVD